MTPKIQNNTQALGTARSIAETNNKQMKSAKKLASGYKVNTAADDAAALAISEKIMKEVKGLSRASVNAQDGISSVQIADGALSTVSDSLNRMNELTIQASNGLLSKSDREAIQAEINQLVDDIDRISSSTKFNETSLLEDDDTVKIQAGASGDSANQIGINLQGMNSDKLGIKGIDVTGSDPTNALGALEKVSGALEKVSGYRSDLGATQNRFEHTINNLDNVVENSLNSYSRMRDTNYASEMVNYSSNNIINNFKTSLLAQANQNSSRVLGLLN